MPDDHVTKSELKQALAESEQRIVEQLTETIRDAQTDVLRAFYNWARPMDAKVRHVDELSQRLGWIEERVTALEKDKLLGGQP